ncbi:MAG: S8 family serine peptidase, partial [Phycisphaerales bacterium]|nr:S8 family serine peptidase [Phycisphaerales bacterium]
MRPSHRTATCSLNRPARTALLHAAAGLLALPGVASAQMLDLSPAAPGWGQYVEHNGGLYAVQKSYENGQEVTRFGVGQQWLTDAEFRALIAAQPPQIIQPALAGALAQARATDSIDVAILLRPQPASVIARQVRQDLAPVVARIDELGRQMRAISGSVMARPSMPTNADAPMVPGVLDEGAIAQRRALAAQLDDLERSLRQETHRRIAASVQPDHDALAAFITMMGGQVTSRAAAVSVVGARLPAAQIAAIAQHPLVATIDIDHPGAPELDNHKHSLGLVTGFWANNITGGVFDVGVLDTGVFNTHPALVSHPFLSNFGGGDTNGHGTGMAGIMASTDSTFTGMAFGCDTIVAAIAGSITTSMPGMDYIASTGEPENVNYSFGNGTANSSDYSTTDQFFDGVIDTFAYMVSKSTGNGGWSATGITITHPAPAYNLMASANMDDFNSQNRTTHRITSSSSTGGTVAGRKKPDIAAPGNNSMSTNTSGGFSNIGGTSSASPHTGASIVLLYDLGVNNVTAGKAILINTADAINENNTSTTTDDFWVDGSFWSRRYGWGYLNLGRAYTHGLDYFVDSVPPAPENADFRLYVGQMFENEKATLVWRRHVAYNGATFPTQIESLSDLDLTAWNEASNAMIASSASPIDNVEQLDVDQDAIVVLKVEAFGTFDPDVPTEEFALATQENFVAATGPVFAGSIGAPVSVAPGQTFVVNATIQNTGDLNAHNVMATVSGAGLVSGANPMALGTIADGASAPASWTLQAPAVAGPFVVSVAIASNSYGESFEGVINQTIMVGGGTCQPDLTTGAVAGQPGYGVPNGV